MRAGRSAVWFSAPALGAGGPEFESRRPDFTAVAQADEILIS